MSKNTRNRILLTALAALLLVTLAIGGTVAYLQAETTQVTNEFTPAKINVNLEETLQSDGTELEENEQWTAQLIPGMEYAKNPKVTVTADEANIASYLFVKVTGAESAEAVLSNLTFFYEADTTWQALGTSYPGVYYQKLDDTTDGYTVDLIAGNTVTVSTAGETASIAGFELSFQAWIIQQYGFSDAVDAWTTGLNSGT